MKKIKALSFPEDVATPETYRIGIAFRIRHRKIEDCVSRMGWERTLSGQSGTRRTRRRDKRATAEGRKGRASVAEILRRGPIPLIMRSGNVPSRRALLTSFSLFLASIYFV